MALFNFPLPRIIPIILGRYDFISFKCWVATFILVTLAEPTQAIIKKTGPYHDSGIYVIGWSSAAYTTLGDGRNCILFLYGHATAEDPNNSIRCFDSATGKVSYAQVDTEGRDKVVRGDGLNDRDNHLSLSIPGRGLLVTGGAYLKGKEYFGGFFDYETLHWDYRNDIYALFTKPDVFDWSTFNPATAWSEELNVGFVYGGYVSGTPSDFITLIHPLEDGRFQLEPLNIPNTSPCMHMRNSAVAVGEWAYVVGGICRQSPGSKAKDVPWFRRFNLVTHQWQQLDDLPVVRYLPQVTYDKRTHDIVVYGGNGPASVQPGIAPNKMPGYWTGRNDLFTWSVHNQGPWVNRTAEANMPTVRMPVGAYDPTTGLHCYRGGQYFNDQGKRIAGAHSSSTIWCLQLVTSGPEVTPSPKKSLPSDQSDSARTKPPKPRVISPPRKDLSSAQPDSARAKLLSKPIVSSSRETVGYSADKRIRALQEKLNGLLLRYTEKHPDVIAIKDTLSMLREQKTQGVKRNQKPRQYQSSNPKDLQLNSGNRIKTAVHKAERLKMNSSTTAHPAAVVKDVIHVNALSRLLPPIKSGLSPRNYAKHMRMTELGNRRLYIVAGDWGAADGRVPDGRQDTHSYDVFTDTWRLEVPYCLPDGKYPFHPDEVGQMWDSKRGVMWLGPGIRYPYKDTCNMGGGLGAMAYFNPKTAKWDRSKTMPPIPETMQHTPRPPTNGIYDGQTDKLVFIDDKRSYTFDPNTETWETYRHPYGRFSDGYVTQVGRFMYVIDEKPYTLYRLNIDTHVLERVSDLPDDIRDGNGDDHGRVYLSALGKRIALYQELNAKKQPKSLLYIYDTQANSFQKVTWDNNVNVKNRSQAVKGNTMTWHSSGWMVLFGCTGDAGCTYANHMDHIYLVDLRQFGGTGEDLPN
jgi:hypothetical protein